MIRAETVVVLSFYSGNFDRIRHKPSQVPIDVLLDFHLLPQTPANRSPLFLPDLLRL